MTHEILRLSANVFVKQVLLWDSSSARRGSLCSSYFLYKEFLQLTRNYELDGVHTTFIIDISTFTAAVTPLRGLSEYNRVVLLHLDIKVAIMKSLTNCLGKSFRNREDLHYQKSFCYAEFSYFNLFTEYVTVFGSRIYKCENIILEQWL